ncbi:MAG: DUF3298 and DUF4163 domain-containing protein [Oscillospiraceae bacterium]|nr:DUF3298 and DUF4163 domain-containing protein [Oscillospiraceae bacterium]
MRAATALLLAALTLVMLAACGKEGEPSAPPTPTAASDFLTDDDRVIYSETIELGNTSLFAMASVPRTGVAAIDDFYLSRLEDFVSDAAEVAEGLREPEPPSHTTLEYSANFEIVRDDGEVLSVRREIYSYFGGAHDNSDTLCDNFSLPDGNILELDDFFTVPQSEYLPRLTGLIADAIAADPDPGRFYSDAADIIAEQFPFGRFCAAEDGLVFYFPPYEIGPYAAGTIEIAVLWSELSDITA